MKYKRVSVVILLVSFIFCQVESVEFCQSFLDSLQRMNGNETIYKFMHDSLRESVNQWKPDTFETKGPHAALVRPWGGASWPRVHWQVSEMSTCVPVTPSACALRKEYPRGEPLLHVMHYASEHVTGLTNVHLRIDYPQAIERPLIWVLNVSTKSEHFFYLDVSSILIAHNMAGVLRPTMKHHIIVLGSRAFVALEQWETSNVVMIHKASDEVSRMSENELVTYLKRQGIVSVAMEIGISTSYHVPNCVATEITLHPLVTGLMRLSHLNNHSSTQPQRVCNEMVSGILGEMYELRHRVSRASVTNKCYVEPVALSSSNVGNMSGGNFTWITHLQLHEWHLLEEQEGQSNIVIKTDRHLMESGESAVVFTVEISAPPPHSNTEDNKEQQQQEEQQYPPMLVLVLDLPPMPVLPSSSDKNVNHVTLSENNDKRRVRVNVDNVHVPIIIESTLPLEMVESANMSDVRKKRYTTTRVHTNRDTMLSHLRSTYCLGGLLCYMDYHQVPAVRTPPQPDRLLVNLQVRFHHLPSRFSEVLETRSRTQCTGTTSASVEVDLTKLPTDSFATPPSNVKLSVGNLKAPRHCVVPQYPNSEVQKWLIVEDHVTENNVCGWKHVDGTVFNMLILDHGNERYFHVLYCNDENTKTVQTPTFLIQVYGDSGHKQPLSSSTGVSTDVNLSSRSGDIRGGVYLYSELRMTEAELVQNSDFTIVDCDLVYSMKKEVGEYDDTVEETEIGRQTLLSNACPPQHLFYYTRPPDDPPWANKSFGFEYPAPPSAVKEMLESWRLHNNSQTTRPPLNVYLQCLVLPCQRSVETDTAKWDGNSANHEMLIPFGQCLHHDMMCSEPKKTGIVRVTSGSLFAYTSDSMPVSSMEPKPAPLEPGHIPWEWCAGSNCTTILGLLVLCMVLLGSLLGYLVIYHRHMFCYLTRRTRHLPPSHHHHHHNHYPPHLPLHYPSPSSTSTSYPHEGQRSNPLLRQYLNASPTPPPGMMLPNAPSITMGLLQDTCNNNNINNTTQLTTSSGNHEMCSRGATSC